MRGQWAYVDFVRSFMPDWLARATSFKVFGVVILALIAFVIVLKTGLIR